MSLRGPPLVTPSARLALPGACHAEGGADFCVFAPDAERVELCVLTPEGRETSRRELPECTDGWWRGHLPDANGPLHYGYRVSGTYQPQHGHRFNAHKLLLDPYARRVAGQLTWSDALYGYRIGSKRGDLSFDRRDSAPYMPHAVLDEQAFDWEHDAPPSVPWADTVVYEMHVRGFTMRHPAVPEAQRGRVAALAEPAVTDYLRKLGVTAIELLPVHFFVRDRALVERDLTNYWGYNTLGFFAPDPAYGTPEEFKAAVKALHRAGLEVILDVVYNHTAEGDERGPTLSLRGFANARYYRLADGRHHVNDTGCGNTLNASTPQALRLVLDSLRHWVLEYHVDGFRFDLGVTLGREPKGFDPGSGFFDALLQDPVLSRVKLIMEPWDLGPGGYQVGRNPAGVAEWNDKYRDEVRRFWRGDAGMRGALAARLQGSADLFDHDRRRPHASVNFITAHDGFTLADWASYEHKHNEANGEDNRDGTDANFSHNFGAEGPTDDRAVIEARGSAMRAMLATLLFSHGTPMLLGGDESGRTQHGNNNAYCQDNELSWLDWPAAEAAEARSLRACVTRMLTLRREHVSLRCDTFQHGRDVPADGIRDVQWFNESGDEMGQEDWQFAEGRLLCVRRAARRGDGHTDVSLLLLNASREAREFTLPGPDLAWRFCLDTAKPDDEQRDFDGAPVTVAPGSLQLYVASAPSIVMLSQMMAAAAQPQDYAPHPDEDDEA